MIILLPTYSPLCWFAWLWAESRRCLPCGMSLKKGLPLLLPALCGFQFPERVLRSFLGWWLSATWEADTQPPPHVRTGLRFQFSLDSSFNFLPGHGAAFLTLLHTSRAPGFKQGCRFWGCHQLRPHVLCADSDPQASGTPGSL